MGKGLAEFRKASDDFKRTWEREVALETSRSESAENPVLNDESNPMPYDSETFDQPLLEPADPDNVIARQNAYQPNAVPVSDENTDDSSQPEQLRKHDWL